MIWYDTLRSNIKHWNMIWHNTTQYDAILWLIKLQSTYRTMPIDVSHFHFALHNRHNISNNSDLWLRTMPFFTRRMVFFVVFWFRFRKLQPILHASHPSKRQLMLCLQGSVAYVQFLADCILRRSQHGQKFVRHWWWKLDYLKTDINKRSNWNYMELPILVMFFLESFVMILLSENMSCVNSKVATWVRTWVKDVRLAIHAPNVALQWSLSTWPVGSGTVAMGPSFGTKKWWTQLTITTFTVWKIG